MKRSYQLKTEKKAKRSGYNTNLASEFSVMATLYRLGYDAYLTLGNKKAVDIVVVRAPGDTATIDVKAVAGKVDWLVGNVRTEPKANHFVVLLSFEGAFEDPTALPRVWVMPHSELVELIRQAKPPSKIRFISRKTVLAECDEWADAWPLIEGGVRSPGG